MRVHDDKDRSLESYVAKDIKAAEIALNWIRNCPGSIVHFPEEPGSPMFFFNEEEINELISVIYNPRRMAYLFRKASEEGFWDDLLNWSMLFDEDDIDREVWQLLRQKFINFLFKFGDDSNT